MPFIKSSPDVVRIDLPHPGEWVEVKAKMGRGDQRAVAQRMLRGRKPGDVAGLDAFDASDLYEAAFYTMEVVITGWSFEEPITPENIRDLDDESVAVINERLQELYPVRDEDERKNSSGPTSEPSNPEANSRKSSAG